MRNIGTAMELKHWLPGPKGLQHSKLRAFERFYDLNNFFKFAIVRNPWDRAVSQITYLRDRARAKCFLDKPFKKQLEAYCNANFHVWGQDLSATQADYLTDRTSQLNVDYIGRFENLANSFKEICERIGIHPVPKLSHLMKRNEGLHYSLYFDDESSEWIREKFKRDIEQFQYTFEDHRYRSVGNDQPPRAVVL
jgi:hypothetical protein